MMLTKPLLHVGGQAVLEGVMMRSPHAMAVAVRRPDGRVVLKDEPYLSMGVIYPILKRPILRVATVGRNLSASGRFIVYDRVGIELQEAALMAKRRFYDAAGNAFQVGEIDFQLGALQRRSAQIRDMAGAFGGILANMTDEGIVRYIESTIRHGEFSTLQNLTAKP